MSTHSCQRVSGLRAKTRFAYLAGSTGPHIPVVRERGRGAGGGRWRGIDSLTIRAVEPRMRGHGLAKEAWAAAGPPLSPRWRVVAVDVQTATTKAFDHRPDVVDRVDPFRLREDLAWLVAGRRAATSVRQWLVQGCDGYFRLKLWAGRVQNCTYFEKKYQPSGGELAYRVLPYGERPLCAVHDRPMRLARSIHLPSQRLRSCQPYDKQKAKATTHRVHHDKPLLGEKCEGVGTHLMVVPEGEGPHEAVVVDRERLRLVRGHGGNFRQY